MDRTKNAPTLLGFVLFTPVMGWLIIISATILAGAADEVKKNFQKERHTA